MKLKGPAIQKLIVSAFLLFLYNIIFAQSTDTTKLSGQKFDMQDELSPLSILPELQPANFDKQNFFDLRVPSLQLNHFNYPLGTNPIFKGLLFSQNKTINSYFNLGNHEHFNNSFIYNASNKIKLNFGFGLVKQNTILNSYGPNYKFSFHSSFEYEITKWLSAYVYGQYLTNPLNAPNDLFDPISFMNPLFFQPETGGGLRSKYKNIKADVGLKTIYDTQFNQSNPVKSMNTKVSIGF